MSFVFSRRKALKLAGAAGLGIAALGAGIAAGHTAAASEPQWRVTGPVVPQLAGFDTMLKSFMQERSISCGALAVTRNTRLVFARGYTWSADANLLVQPDSLFRIASITKPFTATAIMRLVQDGKLQLSQKLTNLISLVPAPGTSADSRLKNVTVLHLLQHLGGWVPPDPMFEDTAIAQALGAPLPINISHITAYTTGRPLDQAPGTAYAYSNYGYCLLGRVIEAVTGKTYQEYVRTTILTPLNITGMQLGRTLPAFRHVREVPYFSQEKYVTVFNNSNVAVPAPDGAFNLENMDSHGGWIASAVDLVRFASTFDTPQSSPILTADSMNSMFARPDYVAPSSDVYYGCGWLVRIVPGGRNTWHNGSLPGTYTLLVRRADGLNWTVLFNQRQEALGLSYDVIDDLLHKVADSISTWPDHDLFPTFLPINTPTPTSTSTPTASATMAATATMATETTVPVTATSGATATPGVTATPGATATLTATPIVGPETQPTTGVYLPVVQHP